MTRLTAFVATVAGTLVLAGCMEETGMSGAPSRAEQVCLRAVSIETNNGDVTLINSREVKRGTRVVVGVGPQRARWECIAYSDGSTSRPMSLTDEGAL